MIMPDKTESNIENRTLVIAKIMVAHFNAKDAEGAVVLRGSVK